MKTSKEQIILNTARLITIKGYSSVSMRDIGESCNILASSLFAHFKSKEEIIKAVADKYVMSVQDPANKFGDCSHMDLLELIDHYTKRVAETAVQLINSVALDTPSLDKNTYTMHLMEFILCMGIDYPDYREKFYEYGRVEDRMFERAIQISIKKGDVRDDIDVKNVAMSFRHLFLGSLYEEGFIGGLDPRCLKDSLMSVYNSIKK